MLDRGRSLGFGKIKETKNHKKNRRCHSFSTYTLFSENQYFLPTDTLWSNGVVVKALDSLFKVPCSKPLVGFKVNSGLQPSEVDKRTTNNFGELIGKK